MRANLPSLGYEYLEIRALLASLVSSPLLDQLAHLSTPNDISSQSHQTKSIASYEVETQNNYRYAVSFDYQLDPVAANPARVDAVDIAVSWNSQVALTVTARPQVSTATLIVEGKAETSRLTFERLDNGLGSNNEMGQAIISNVKIAEVSRPAAVGLFSVVSGLSSTVHNLVALPPASPNSAQRPDQLPGSRATRVDQQPISLVAIGNQHSNTGRIEIEVERDRFFQSSTSVEIGETVGSFERKSQTAMLGRFQKIGLIDDVPEIVFAYSNDWETFSDSTNFQPEFSLVDDSLPGELVIGSVKYSKSALNQWKPQTALPLREMVGYDSEKFPVISSGEELLIFHQNAFVENDMKYVAGQNLRPIVSLARPKMVLVSWRETNSKLPFDDSAAEVEPVACPDQGRDSRHWKIALISVASLFIGGIWRKRKRKEKDKLRCSISIA